MNKIVLFCCVITLFLASCQQKKPTIFFPLKVEANGDTTYQTIAPFEMKNQYGETITEKNVQGKIYVVDFFFTTCPGICKKMTNEMQQVQMQFVDNKYVNFLSFSIDTETDSVAQLKRYAEHHKIKGNQWHLLTGKQFDATHISQDIFHLSAFRDADGIIQHDERYVLVDKKGRIRGYYHVTEPEKLKQLVEDIHYLLKNE